MFEELDLATLRTCLEVADTGSFSKAATKLGVSQPRVSARVKSLEKHLDLQLFERNTRKVRLSAAGLEMLPKLRYVIGAADNLICTASTINKNLDGQIIIGATPWFSKSRWAILEKFYTSNPVSSLEIVNFLTDAEMVKALSDGHLDMGFSCSPIPDHLNALPIDYAKCGILARKVDIKAEPDAVNISYFSGKDVAIFRREMNPELHALIIKHTGRYKFNVIDVCEPSIDSVIFEVENKGIPVICNRWTNNKELSFTSCPDGLVHIPFESDFPQIRYNLVRRHSPARPIADALWRNAQTYASEMVERYATNF